MLLLVQKLSFNESELSPVKDKQNKTKSRQLKIHTGLKKIFKGKREGRKETTSDISVFLLEAVSSVF